MIKGYFAFADGAARMLLRVTMVLLVALIATTNYEVIARYVFSAPTLWAFDISYMTNGTLLVLATAFTLRVDEHVKIDVFSARLPQRAQLLIRVVFYLVFFLPVIGLLTVVAIGESWHAYVTEDRVLDSAWKPLTWPFYSIISIGLAALWFQVVADLIRRLLRWREPHKALPHDLPEDAGRWY